MSFKSLFKTTKLLFRLNYDFINRRLKRKFAGRKDNDGRVRGLPPVAEILNRPYIFVLSTGRCGTGLVTKILASSPSIRCEHNPKPGLEYVSSLIHYNDFDTQCLKIAVLAARFDLYFLDSWQRGQIYAETNNRISLFAGALAELLPNARFIHLVRDPADFVRSDMRRGYYHKGVMQHQRLDGSKHSLWASFSRVGKIAWEWNEINRKIEEAKDFFDSNRILTVKSEDLYVDPLTTFGIFNFINVDNPFLGNTGRRKLENVLSNPVNKQVEGEFPEYSKWSKSEKEAFRGIVTLAEKYGYTYE